MFVQCVLTLTHASGALVDIDGIWVEELLPAAFEGAEYTYDGDGNLVKSEVNGVVTYYLGKYYEKTVQNGHTSEKKHYSAGSSIIAVRTVIDGTQDTLNWLVGDHLGSTSLVTDSSGTVVSEVRYSAFGEMRYLNGETVTDLLYTSQRFQEELKLYNYGARWYDPLLGRFIQADTVLPDAENSSMYDRYAYVENNPLNYYDPSGHYGCRPGLDGGDCGDKGQTTFLAVEAENERLAALQAYNEQRQAYLECGNGKCPGWNTNAEVLTWAGAGLVLAGFASALVSGTFTPAIESGINGAVTRISTVNPGSSDAVIGGYNATTGGYMQWGKELGASYLKMPGFVEKMFYNTPEAFWPINQTYLDNLISKGAWIILSESYPEVVNATESFFQREIAYLIQNGYQHVNIFGIDWLIPK